MSIGLFFLRVVVGALFVGHGTQKLFGWFGGGGPEGTGRFFEQIGYTPGRKMAYLGVMVGTLPVHVPKGLWNTNGGYELPLVYATAAIALAFAGPGRASVDSAIGWTATGAAIGTAAAAFGCLTGVVMLAVRAGRKQLAEEEQQPQQRRAA